MISRRIDVYIWSKDRALQLDLLLRSIRDNFENISKVYVMYDCSNQNFFKGYEKVTNTDYEIDIDYRTQTNETFKKINEDVAGQLRTKYSLGLCDDSLFIRKTNADDLLDAMDTNPNICATSLRLGLNIKRNYVTKGITKQPDFIYGKNLLMWNWNNCEDGWGYPCAVETQIFNTAWYRAIIKNFKYHIPTTLEGCLFKSKNIFKPLMISFPESHITNLCLNRIQNYSDNKYDRVRNYNPEMLNKKFLDGYIIDERKIYNRNCEYLFQEIDVEFKDQL